MKTKTKHGILIFITLSLAILLTGIIIPHSASKKHNFVGTIGGYIYVDNSSDKNIPQDDLSTFLYILNLGIPNIFSGLQSLVTPRIEIIEVGNIEESCGIFRAKLYTFFNILYFEQNKHIGCS